MEEYREENTQIDDEGIKIEVNIRDKQWRNGLISSIFMLVMSIGTHEVGMFTKSTIASVIGGLGILMFGFFTYIILDPNHHVCMQMVKGEMSYKQLQESISKERFVKPFQLYQGGNIPSLFLVSEKWAIFEDKTGSTVYVPKYKIRTIQFREDILDVSDEESYDGVSHRMPYLYLRFICDEKHIFECGLIPPRKMDYVIKQLNQYFSLKDANFHPSEGDDTNDES